MGKLLTKEIFIEKAKLKHHENLYDYSLFEYINCKTKGKIICPIHGIFEQKAKSHLEGYGCQSCGDTSSNKNIFIEKAKLKHHENLYDYSLFEYINCDTKGDIICSVHGVFKQTPNAHLVGKGCLKCSILKRTFTKEIFIEKAQKIHGTLYNYSLFEYINMSAKSKIICSKHGIFFQNADKHLRGQGCQMCTHMISKPETAWLDSFDNQNLIRQFKIKLKNEKYSRSVDGYDPKTNTIYQFHGDYYHGHPKIFHPLRFNQTRKKFMYELYEDIIKKDKKIEDSGYNLIVIWEHEWNLIKNLPVV